MTEHEGHRTPQQSIFEQRQAYSVELQALFAGDSSLLEPAQDLLELRKLTVAYNRQMAAYRWRRPFDPFVDRQEESMQNLRKKIDDKRENEEYRRNYDNIGAVLQRLDNNGDRMHRGIRGAHSIAQEASNTLLENAIASVAEGKR